MKRPSSCLKRPASHDNDSESLGGTTLELPGLGEEFTLQLKGLNVRPPFAGWLVHGLKSVEVRKYDLSTHGMSQVMFVIQTKNCRTDVTQVIGVVEFWDLTTKYYSMQDLAFHSEYHKVDDVAIFGLHWTSKKTLYGWHVRQFVEFERPVVVAPWMPTRSMLGWLKPVSLKVTLDCLDAEKMRDIMTRHQC